MRPPVLSGRTTRLNIAAAEQPGMRFLAAMLMLFALAPVAYGETGHITLLAVPESQSGYEGSLADLYLTITPREGLVFLDTYPLSRLDTQISTRFAKEVACAFLERDCSHQDRKSTHLN